jgi:glycosyltransferase involved in cell wall biosynthesis
MIYTMSKLLFVVHRYAPFPGGSEYYVQDMAEEALKRGHDVTVLAHTHQGNLNGVKATSDYNILLNKWDLIIVHGSDMISQNVVHCNAYLINQKSPVCYMIIKPSDSRECITGIYWHRYLAYSTSMDIKHIEKYGDLQKARRIRHGIVPDKTIVPRLLMPRDPKVGGYYFVSAGGFYPHKAMVPLAKAWEELAWISTEADSPNI